MDLNDRRVMILKADEYDETIDNTVAEGLSFFENDHFRILPGMKVLVKANLLMSRKPEEATTTHPSVIAAICRYVISRGAQPIIADSPGGPFTSANLKKLYRVTGMETAAERSGAKLNCITSSHKEKTDDLAVVVSEFSIIDALSECDLLIDAAKLKTHSLTLMTCSVKNLFGLVPGLTKAEYHVKYPNEKFFDMLVDLCLHAKPAVCVADAVWCMEGDGPSGGRPVKLGALMFSQNPFALDCAAASMIGFEAKNVPYLEAAIKRGVISGSLDDIEFYPLFPKDISRDFAKPAASGGLKFNLCNYLPAPVRSFILNRTKARPVVAKKTCVGCGACADICPAHAITVSGNKASIDPELCIRCYCCHEMCPIKSIDMFKGNRKL